MAKILIPTPLRPYTDKQASVDAAGATVGELLADLTRRHAGLKAHLYNEQGKLRSFVNVYINDEDIRYLQKEQTPVNAGDTISIIPSVAGGVETADRASGVPLRFARPARRPPQAPELTNDEIKRYSRHLIMPEVGIDGSAEAEGRQRALHRRRRTWIAGRDVSGGRRHRQARHCRLRHGRFQQPAAADPPRHAGRRAAEAGIGEGPAAGVESRTSTSKPMRRRSLRRTRCSCSSRTTSSSTGPTTSRRGIS